MDDDDRDAVAVVRRDFELAAFHTSEGRKALRAGATPADCPYADWSAESIYWLQGLTGSAYCPIWGHA